MPQTATGHSETYTPSTAMQFFLRGSNSEGRATTVFSYGDTGDRPIAGDWDGDGDDTIGIYRSSDSTFHLRNSNSAGPADQIVATGAAGDIPIVGDWDGDGDDTIGVYRPSTRKFYLKNVNTANNPDAEFVFGAAAATPIVGDWNGDKTDTIGLYDPGSNTWSLRNSNSAGGADISFQYGSADDLPVVGDWNGDKTDTVGVRRGGAINWLLRNSNDTSGSTSAEFRFGGIGSPWPITGDWNGDEITTIGLYHAPAPDRWFHRYITYGFVNDTGDIAGSGEFDAIRSAMSIWSKASGLTFTEVNPLFADLKIGWQAPWADPEWPFVPAGNSDWAHTSFPVEGTILFNEGETWTASTRSGTSPPIDLVTVAAHAIGHALGLQDSESGGVMHFKYTGSARTLSSSEVSQIATRYGTHTSEERFFLRNSHSPGWPDVVFDGVCAGAMNIFSGDWDGDGYDSVACMHDPCGVCNPRGIYYTNAHGLTENTYIEECCWGSDDDTKLLAGDWDGDGKDTPGVFDKPNAAFGMFETWDLKNENPMIGSLGDSTDIPLVGDWNGDGKDSIGVYRPSNSVFYLRNKLATGPVDYSIPYGNAGDIPVVGDWNEDGIDTIGLYRPSNGIWYLNNTLASTGTAYQFPYGNVGGIVPIVGDWNASGTDTVGFAQY